MACSRANFKVTFVTLLKNVGDNGESFFAISDLPRDLDLARTSCEARSHEDTYIY
jgi:hypothetical protein